MRARIGHLKKLVRTWGSGWSGFEIERQSRLQWCDACVSGVPRPGGLSACGESLER